MRIEVTSRSDRANETARRLATEKAERLVKYFDRTMAMKVILDEDSGQAKVEILATPPRHATVVVETKHEDMLAAIDVAVDKMERALTKLKERLQDRHRKPRAEGTPEDTGSPDDEGPTYQQAVEELP